MALLETLADQMARNMDIDALTQELQNRSKARHAARVLREPSPPSLPSSIHIIQDGDVLSDAGSAAVSVASSSNGAESVDMSASFTTATTENSSGLGSAKSDSGASSSMSVSEASIVRTNGELWNDVKILTLTRTLTTIYATTLLSLLTSIQLTLLARSKYIHAIVQQERDERMRDIVEAQFSLSNILFNADKIEKLVSQDMSGLLLEDDIDVFPGGRFEEINEQVEGRFLTLSWWILHVGWKDIAERVRRGVEEVFDGVSLKTKIAAIDLHRLVSDVRRRVEHEITFEGTERRVNFLSSLLPPTPETVQHVLIQGGFPSHHSLPSYIESLDFDELASSQFSFASVPEPSRSPVSPSLIPPYIQPPVFTSLLEETRNVIMSSDFMLVLESGLDKATEILFEDLEKNLFSPSFGDDHHHHPQVVPEGSEDARMRLASVLPGLAKWSAVAMRGIPNELVDHLLDMRETKCLSAVVFGRFEQMIG